MRFLPSRDICFLLAYLVGACILAGGVWRIGYVSALENVAARGEADLDLASDRLIGQLQRFQELAVLMADHPALILRLRAGAYAPGDIALNAQDLLLSVADKTGVANIILLDRLGRIQAAAHPQLAARIDHTEKTYFARAMHGATGSYHSVFPGDPRRTFSVAAPIYRSGDRPLGAVVVVADIESTEADWRGDASVFYFKDSLGVVFLANRSELVLTQLTPERGVADPNAEYDSARLKRFPAHRETQVAGYRIWQMQAGRYLPNTAIYLTRDLPVIGFSVEVLADAGPARRLAVLQVLVALAAYLVIGAFLLFVAVRRRRLTRKLEQEEAAKEMLESRVQSRTRALSQANQKLRLEVEERERAETALRAAQAHLVQAGKLSALGEMSAGISHELNQPLMAIGTYAENSSLLIERGKYEVVGRNIEQIGALAGRMGRIIKNLRAFARQEDAPLRDVDPVAVVEAALEISAQHLRAAGVDVHWTPPAKVLRVRAGEVRLQQVLLNLISNATEAMSGSDIKSLTISVVEEGQEHVALRVRDTGPGISRPERIFDPFYSTKAVKQADSMGLGLSISYGLVQSFGGDIKGVNHLEGGAIFTVRLARVAVAE